MDVRQKKRWWAACTHKKTGNLITLDSLVSAGRISDYEMELFDGQTPLPRREMTSMFRVKTETGEFLHRNESWKGLSEIGGIVSIGINGELDYTRRVSITPDTAKLDDGTEVKILKVGTTEMAWYSQPKIYTTPFNEANVLAALEKAPPSMANGIYGKITYGLMKEGTINTTSVSNLQEFMNADFDSLWEQRTRPAPQININSKDLTNYVKLDKEAREAHQQYK
jgi:hypothetical protein